MSGPTFRYKTGLIFAVVAFVLGLTAASALGWADEQNNNHGKKEQAKEHGKKEKGENEQGKKQHGKNEQGKKQHGKKQKEHGEEEQQQGKKQHQQGKKEQPPTATVPTPPVTPPPAAAPPLPVPPVSSQGVPTTPAPQQQSAPEAPEEQEAPESPVVAQQAPGEAAPLAPAAEQRKLAKTGLDPALIAFLGAFSLVGGGFLFRRALAR